MVDLKNAYIRNGDPISKVAYDSKIQVMQHALGQHTYVSRVQGGKLKAKHEIRVATLFRNLPEEFLRMIVVHELAHLKEKSTTRRSMACASAWNQYHQYEFDLRLYLTHLDATRQALWEPAG